MSTYGFEADDDEEEGTAPIALPKTRPAPRRKPRLEAVRASVEEGRALGFVPRQAAGPASAATPGPATARPSAPDPSSGPGEGGRAPRKPGRRKGEPKSQLLISGPVRVLDALRDHCDAQGVTYWEAIEHWLATSPRR